jgi:uncharacterized protein
MSDFRNIRRRERGVTENEAREILARADDGVLATVGPDGWPYAVPVNHVVVDDILYIHCALDGHKLDNIAHEERVSYCAVATATVKPEKFTTSYESAVVFGRAAVVEDPGERRRALDALVARFCGEASPQSEREITVAGPRTAIIRIRVEQISGKANRRA